MKTLGQYHDLYLKTGALLLAEVFQNFRKLCMQYYEFDCAHLSTICGLAWQAALKKRKTPLELLTDINMLLKIERGIRGGISMISTRYCEANNSQVENYNLQIPNSYILYLDANKIDLEYHSHLHDLHNEYAISPEKLRVTEKILSLFAKKYVRK